MTNDLIRNNDFLARLTNLIQLLGPPDVMHFCAECGALEVVWTCGEGREMCRYKKGEDCEVLIVDGDHIEVFDSMWFALRGFCETYDIDFGSESFDDVEETDDFLSSETRHVK